MHRIHKFKVMRKKEVNISKNMNRKKYANYYTDRKFKTVNHNLVKVTYV